MNKFPISSHHIEKGENGLLYINWNGQVLKVFDSFPKQYGTVQLEISELDILISKKLKGFIGIENRIAAMVVSIQQEACRFRVKSISNNCFLETLIHTEVAEEMGLQVGDEIELMVQSHNIKLGVVDFDQTQSEKICLTTKS